MTELRDVIKALHEWYPPASAEDWDAVGLVAGDPQTAVKRVLLAVDPTQAVAEQAKDWKADLLVVHHPLFLKPVNSVAATTAKGKTLATLSAAGCALLTAHTNADHAAGGVSESMAYALGLGALEPLVAAEDEALFQLVAYAPVDAAGPVRAAIADAGAGSIGDYDYCSFTTEGTGRFRPLDGADPAIGAVGELEKVHEVRIEAVLRGHQRGAVLRALRHAHPYETPAFSLFELSGTPLDTGTGRVGMLPEPMALSEFAQHVADRLPVAEQGIRVAGDPDRPIRKVALCGGSGDFLLGQLRHSDADVYITSDLRHHPASEFVEDVEFAGSGPALIDVAHWAAESTWLPVLRARLLEQFGGSVEVRVSDVRTDPWTMVAHQAVGEDTES